jgi:beta-glucosidase
MSYFTGEFPPAKKNIFEAFNVLRNNLKAHGKAYHIIKNEDPSCKAGLVKHMTYLVANNINNPFDRLGSFIGDSIFNGITINAIKTGNINFPVGVFEHHDYLKDSSDFIGLNYYIRNFCTITELSGRYFRSNNKERLTQMNWTVFPEGIYQCLMKLHRELNIPIYITENGIATDDDNWRIEYIKSHLKETHRAIKEGADVRGYFYWSNMDNFEWAHGFYPTFGIIGIDRENNLKRIIKNSARVYADIIRNNGFED